LQCENNKNARGLPHGPAVKKSTGKPNVFARLWCESKIETTTERQALVKEEKGS
jgi:hypothetical protein